MIPATAANRRRAADLRIRHIRRGEIALSWGQQKAVKEHRRCPERKIASAIDVIISEVEYRNINGRCLVLSVIESAGLFGVIEFRATKEP
jgi:hypothetical protein